MCIFLFSFFFMTWHPYIPFIYFSTCIYTYCYVYQNQTCLLYFFYNSYMPLFNSKNFPFTCLLSFFTCFQQNAHYTHSYCSTMLLLKHINKRAWNWWGYYSIEEQCSIRKLRCYMSALCKKDICITLLLIYVSVYILIKNHEWVVV